MAEKLDSWGYEVTRNVGGHGVVGVLRQGQGTRSIAIRADMDALPITEATGLPYASKIPGKMHACGHDGHTTVLLGAAEYLARTRRFNGTVVLVFQPAEEAGKVSGAQAMIADGLFERFPCDAIFGLHNHPGAPAGSFLDPFRPHDGGERHCHDPRSGQGRPRLPTSSHGRSHRCRSVDCHVVADRGRAERRPYGHGGGDCWHRIHGGTVTNVIPEQQNLG